MAITVCFQVHIDIKALNQTKSIVKHCRFSSFLTAVYTQMRPLPSRKTDLIVQENERSGRRHIKTALSQNENTSKPESLCTSYVLTRFTTNARSISDNT